MNAQTEHTPNRITTRCFFAKPVGSVDWSLASNVSHSREHGLIGLAAALKLDEFQNSTESVNKTETNSVQESLNTKKSDDDSDDNEDQEIPKLNNEEQHENSDPNEIKPSYLSEPVNQITGTNPVNNLPSVEESLDTESDEDEEKQGVEDDGDYVKETEPNDSNEPVHKITETKLVPPLLPVKELQDTEISDSNSDDEEKELDDDVKEIIEDYSSMCGRSDRSNNSISSFSFPILHNEDGSVKTPYFERSWNVCDKRSELSRDETQTRLQKQFYFIPASQMPPQLPPQESSLAKQASQTQSQKAFRNRCFSCFYGSSQDY